MTDRIFRVFMREGSTGEVHAFEGQWVTFAEAASAAYQERSKLGHRWKITQVTEVFSDGHNSLLHKLANHLTQGVPQNQISSVLNSLPSDDRAKVMDLMAKQTRKEP